MEALIIVDIQNDYFENGKMELVGSLEASERSSQILEKFRQEQKPVFHIQHIGIAPEATFFLPNTEGAKIHKNVQPKDDEELIVKYYPNSFRETNLHEKLQKLGVTNLVICGMMTHMCIDATTRAAKDLGYECTLISDACATRDLEFNGKIAKAEEVQMAFLSALAFFYAEVTTSKEYLVETAIKN